jgi:transcriptional regulator with XRE-family HTH domain
MCPYFATSSGELQVSFWYVSILLNTVEGRMVQIPRLREWREARALTQVELAERAGVSSRSVAGYEAGAGARPPTVRRLAEALGVEVADLRGVPERPPLGPAPASQQLTLNGELEEERRAAWEAAADEARRLRKAGWAQMWKALSEWRASKSRGEPYATRRKCLDEMGNLLQEVYDADVELGRAYLAAALTTKGGSEASGPRYLRQESRATGHFYGELLGLVKSARLSVRTGGDAATAKQAAQQPAAEHVQSETMPLRVEETIAA